MSVIRPAVAGCVRALAKNHMVGSRSVRDRFAIAMLELYKGKTSSKSLSSFSPFLAEVVNSALRCHFGKCRRRAREQEWIQVSLALPPVSIGGDRLPQQH